ncbi:MAG: exodeoxyribonuclease VII small subunit [Rickettsiales bacterium]|nr:exodeoxyribonuclease VII small subunit [Rickettsiales bacterium]
MRYPMKKIDELSFEESFKKLNETIELLEKGEISLDESIELYEQGLLLKNHCEEKLKNAELKIQKVIEKNK